MLYHCCEAIRSLIYPLRFEGIFIPHITPALFDRLYLPTSFIVGLEKKYEKDVKEMLRDGTFIVNLDDNEMLQHCHTKIALDRLGIVSDIITEDLPFMACKEKIDIK